MPLFVLPREILQCHVFPLLSIPNIANCDTAITSRVHRPIWLSALKDAVYDSVALLRDENVIDWLIQKKMIVRSLGLYKITQSLMLKASEAYDALHSVKVVSRDIDNALLEALIGGCPRLRSITMRDHSRLIGPALVAIADMCHELQSIHIAVAGVRESDIIALFRGCHHLHTITLNVYVANHITAATLSALAQYCPDLKHFSINGTNAVLADADIVTFASKFPNLETFEMNLGRGVTDEGCIAMLAHCPLLQTISLRGALLTDLSVIAIAEHCPHLKNLLCANHMMSDNALFAIAHHSHQISSICVPCGASITDAGIAILNKCISLRSIRFDTCEYYNSDAIASLVLPNLESLTFHFADIEDEILISVAKNHPNLKSICLRVCEHITDYGVTRLSEYCTQLNSVEFRMCDITDAAIMSLALSCPLLDKLVIHDCDGISDTSIVIVSHLCKGLRYLEACGIPLTLAAYHALAIGCPSLLELDICAIYDRGKLIRPVYFFDEHRPNLFVADRTSTHIYDEELEDVDEESDDHSSFSSHSSYSIVSNSFSPYDNSGSDEHSSSSSENLESGSDDQISTST